MHNIQKTILFLLMVFLPTVVVKTQSYKRAPACFALGASTQMPTVSNRLPVPSSNPANLGIIREANRMKKCMDVDADLMYSPTLFNALADPDTNEVVLGEPLWRQAAMKGQAYVDLAMGFVLAHEYAHIFQFKMVNNELGRLGNSTPLVELQADMLAGYYGGARLEEQLGNNEFMINQAGNLFIQGAADLGDYAFYSQSHHGTPSQRAAATLEGFRAGRSEKFGNLDTAFSDRDDEIFEWSKKRAREIFQNSY